MPILAVFVTIDMYGDKGGSEVANFRGRWYHAIMVAMADILFLFFSTFLAFTIRFGTFVPPDYNWSAYTRIAFVQFATLIVVFYIYGLYGEANHKTSSELLSLSSRSIRTPSRPPAR